MPEKTSASKLSLLVGILIGGSIAAFVIAAVTIFKHEGTPVLMIVAGSLLAMLAAIIGLQARAKR